MAPLWLETPLVYSPHISARLGANAYLKLESLQPSQSFKYRGISHYIQRALDSRGPSVHLIVASGGNAGLAAATAAKALGLLCSVYLPKGATDNILTFFKQQGADVHQHGDVYSEALAAAKAAVESDSNAVLVPAYEDPLLWEGHSSMIEETAKQLSGVKPDAVLCSVGGGGLLGGVIQGCKKVGWDDASVIGWETTGSNCFYESVALNPGPFDKSSHVTSDNVTAIHDEKSNVKIAKLAKLTSKAASLGATSPAPEVVKMALERKGGIKCICGPDELAMQTALLFADEHKMLVELACATTLIPAYKPDLFDKLVPPHQDGSTRTVVFIVCGGYKIYLDEMLEYQQIVDESPQKEKKSWNVFCNGEEWSIGW
ncbi:tryptophan synthase beta subunit-like PLP-dependent enzyme [Panus rudis PR-1116 ss-1]|nr:tryptophan synthase beta subunit-like PLP-dependent enzyme [Panus rudis PR-1116 ss-1]